MRGVKAWIDNDIAAGDDAIQVHSDALRDAIGLLEGIDDHRGLVPVLLNQEELVGLLREMADAVEGGDSYEGSLEYLIPSDLDQMDKHEVRAVFRVGNSDGSQGGVRMIGTVGG
jgi:hypothetical protein